MKKVVLYGIGWNFDIFMKYGDLNDFEIVALVDSYKYGECRGEWIIKHPKEMPNLNYDEIYLLISDSPKAKIIEYLTGELQVERSKIRCTETLNQQYILGNMDFTKYRYVMFTDAQDYLNWIFDDLCNRSDFLRLGIMDQDEEIDYDEKMFNEEIIFIFRDHRYNTFKKQKLFSLIKKKYPKSKLVLHISDSISGDYGRLAEYGSNYVQEIKMTFDLIITYHFKEALKYGLTHYPQVYPFHPLKFQPSTDILFIGNAKDRLDVIHRAFIHLKKNGITCRFWINKVSEEKQLKNSDIIYNKPLSYDECRKEIARCRCILEICKKGNETSMRYAEAVINNKKLIVDDAGCKNRKYYSSKFIQCINEPEDIDCSWIEKECVVDYHYENDFDPENYLLFLEAQLSKQQE